MQPEINSVARRAMALVEDEVGVNAPSPRAADSENATQDSYRRDSDDVDACTLAPSIER